MFGSALLRREGVRGFGFGIGCSGVIQMARDGRRQVGIGHIGVGTVTVVTSSQFDICTLVLPFTFSLLIPGPTHPQRPPFVIHSGVLLYTARPHSWTHRLVLSLLYLICSYFAVFFFSSNIKYDTSHMLCSSQSLTRLSSCRECTSMSKALL